MNNGTSLVNVTTTTTAAANISSSFVELTVPEIVSASGTSTGNTSHVLVSQAITQTMSPPEMDFTSILVPLYLIFVIVFFLLMFEIYRVYTSYHNNEKRSGQMRNMLFVLENMSRRIQPPTVVLSSTLTPTANLDTIRSRNNRPQNPGNNAEHDQLEIEEHDSYLESSAYAPRVRKLIKQATEDPFTPSVTRSNTGKSPFLASTPTPEINHASEEIPLTSTASSSGEETKDTVPTADGDLSNAYPMRDRRPAESHSLPGVSRQDSYRHIESAIDKSFERLFYTVDPHRYYAMQKKPAPE